MSKLIKNPHYNPKAIKELSENYENVLEILLFASLPERTAEYIEVPDNYPEEMVQEMIDKGCTQKEIFKAIQQYFKEHGVQG